MKRSKRPLPPGGLPIREIIWTPQAEQDRAAVWDYLVVRDSAAALRIDQLFSDAVARLADFPLLGHVLMARLPGRAN